MTDKDSEWMAMVAYARAAGARNVDEASEWARNGVDTATNWHAFCKRIDEIASVLGAAASPVTKENTKP